MNEVMPTPISMTAKAITGRRMRSAKRETSAAPAASPVRNVVSMMLKA